VRRIAAPWQEHDVETKGNAILRAQLTNLASGLTFWEEAHATPAAENPLLQCDFNYLGYKLKVLDRLRHYASIELCDKQRLRLVYLCSGSDHFCRIVESLGLIVTTLDMCPNEYSRRHVQHVIRDDRESAMLVADLIEQHDIVLWDTSIGHLDAGFIRSTLPRVRTKTYLLGIYDVPKRRLFGERVLSNPLMANLLRNSRSTNAGLYADILPVSKLQFSVDMGAFSLLLYDNIVDFPINDRTLIRYLEAADAIA
jgi:hypothetical protein